LIQRLRQDLPLLPIIYLANTGRSTPEVEASLPPDVLILREPFTAAKVRAAVSAKLDGKGDGKRRSRIDPIWRSRASAPARTGPLY
jgi:hypothetical protein